MIIKKILTDMMAGLSVTVVFIPEGIDFATIVQMLKI
jgi:MFS superfamily sulfate permease-like transporter